MIFSISIMYEFVINVGIYKFWEQIFRWLYKKLNADHFLIECEYLFFMKSEKFLHKYIDLNNQNEILFISFNLQQLILDRPWILFFHVEKNVFL